jgi:hypothetical protein
VQLPPERRLPVGVVPIDVAVTAVDPQNAADHSVRSARPRRPARYFAYRTARGGVSPDRVRDTAVVLSNLDGTHRHPERFSRRFTGQLARARKALGENQSPVIRLYDLQHPYATLLQADGVPVKVVSECLGHASATITLTVSQHVHPGRDVPPGMGREAADRFAALLQGCARRQVSNSYHARTGGPNVKRLGPLTCRELGRCCVRGATRYIRTRLDP